MPFLVFDFAVHTAMFVSQHDVSRAKCLENAVSRRDRGLLHCEIKHKKTQPQHNLYQECVFLPLISECGGTVVGTASTAPKSKAETRAPCTAWTEQS
eukprot:2439652-Rhodomonas_salina.1